MSQAGLDAGDALDRLISAVKGNAPVDLVRKLAELVAHTSTAGQLPAVMMRRSAEALGPALAEPEVDTSPQLARSLQATENAWRAIEREFGLLTSREVSERLGSRSPNRSYASDQHSRGRLIAVRRAGGMRFPGFQIDPVEQQIRPVIEDLLRIARSADVSEASLALWLCTPTGYLDGERPVDRLDRPEEVAEAAESAFGVEW